VTARPASDLGQPVAEEKSHIVVAFDDNRLIPELFGEFDQNLALIEQRLGVEAVARGNQVALTGSPDALTRARLALDILYGRLQSGHEIAPGDVDGAIRMATAAEAQLSLPSLEPRGRLAMAQIATRRRTVVARTPTQDAYIRAFDRVELTFGIGPAGTGTSIGLSCRARRARGASGSASCRATCARRSTLICVRSTTPFTT
jgi:phosphate starvation-inducible PhoH-like protein